MGGDVDGACFALDVVVKEGSFQANEGVWTEMDVGEVLAEVG